MGMNVTATIALGVELDREKTEWFTEELEEEYGSIGEFIEEIFSTEPEFYIDLTGSDDYVSYIICVKETIQSTDWDAVEIKSIGFNESVTDKLNLIIRLLEVYNIPYINSGLLLFPYLSH